MKSLEGFKSAVSRSILEEYITDGIVGSGLEGTKKVGEYSSFLSLSREVT